MEKIININFQGRLIPIEEGAYNSLKKYVDSLRGHFANEESSDEIINDIENRIAELLTERLKSGAACIGNSDLNAVIDSIGRLEDIEAAEGEDAKAPKSTYTPPGHQPVKGRFFRNADDKIIAGVCSGIAYRMGIDPVIIRILFVLMFAAIFWIYILLWIIVPSKSIDANITKRLFRNPDSRIIAGVCGGLAVYFKVDTWIPRVVFVLPLIISVLSGSVHTFWWDWPIGIGPSIFAGSFGSTMFILYIVLWIAVPYARTATDKLEMRGERIDMNSIKAATLANAGATTYQRPEGSGLGRVIGILFKAFFLLVAGTIALALFGILISLLFAGMAVFPFSDYVLDGINHNLLVWGGIILCLGVPLLAIVTWLIRRLMGVRSRRHYLGYIFTGLWFIGVLCVISAIGIFMNNFKSKSMVEESYQIQQPSQNKLYINVTDNRLSRMQSRHNSWFDEWDEEEDMPFYFIDKNTLWLNTVKIKVAQSPDSLYHIYETRSSRGKTSEDAKRLASNITFGINQQDSIIELPNGFTIDSKDKFRNQQVILMIEVPLGKAIEFSKDINSYTWFNINVDERNNFHYDRHTRRRHRNHNHSKYSSGSEYLMTATGLKNTIDSTHFDIDDED